MNVNMTRDNRIGEQVHVAIDCTGWEYVALLELLDGAEPADGDEAHVLRHLVTGLPKATA